MARKHQAIDLVKLKALGSHVGWNEMLNDCFEKYDINKLAKTRYQICAGMDDLAKKKLNSEEICNWFIRLQRSLEQTAKQIVRKKHPLPNDLHLSGQDFTKKELAAKRKRDQELAKFWRDSRY